MTHKRAPALAVVSAGHQRPTVSPYQVFASVTGGPNRPATLPARPLTGRSRPSCPSPAGLSSARWWPRRANPEHPPALTFSHPTLPRLNRARSGDRNPGKQARRVTFRAASAEPTAEKRSVASPRAPRPQRQVPLWSLRTNETLRELPAKPTPRPRTTQGG